MFIPTKQNKQTKQIKQTKQNKQNKQRKIATYHDLEHQFRLFWLEKARKLSFLDTFWNDISSNPIISDRIIQEHPTLPWEDMGLIYNNTITWDLFSERIEYALKLDRSSESYREKPRSLRDAEFRNSEAWRRNGLWKYLSEHPNVTPQAIASHPKASWDWYEIYQNPQFTLKDIQKHFITTKNPLEEKLVLSIATLNPNISFKYMISRPDIPWNFPELCSTEKVSISNIVEHPNLRWDGRNLSRNPNITLDFVKQTDDAIFDPDELEPIFNQQGQIQYSRFENIKPCIRLTWDWIQLSCNPAISLQEIEDNPTLPWDEQSLSNHPNLTLDFVERHPEKKWNWSNIQIVCRMSLSHLLRLCPPSELKWEYLSRNNCIGWDDIETYRDKPWNWKYILRNPMTRFRDQWIATKRLEWIAASRIHRWYRWVSYCPEFRFAQRRLLKELHSSDSPCEELTSTE